jgi:hypothetical protein
MASEIVSTAEIGKAHLRRRMTQQQGTANRTPDQTNSETVRGIAGGDFKGYERMPCIRESRVGGALVAGNNRVGKNFIQDRASGVARHEVSLFVLVDVAVCVGSPVCGARDTDMGLEPTAGKESSSNSQFFSE